MLNTDRSFANHIDGRALDDYEVETQSVEELEEEIAELCAHIDAATYPCFCAEHTTGLSTKAGSGSKAKCPKDSSFDGQMAASCPSVPSVFPPTEEPAKP